MLNFYIIVSHPERESCFNAIFTAKEEKWNRRKNPDGSTKNGTIFLGLIVLRVMNVEAGDSLGKCFVSGVETFDVMSSEIGGAESLLGKIGLIC